jgi:hypothetical protein
MSNGREILNALMPEGSFWTPAEDDDYDKLLDGVAQNSDDVKEGFTYDGEDYSGMKDLSSLRDPMKTVVLPELERDYGMVPPVGATDEERRSALKGFMFNRSTNGAYDMLQDKLQEAGFDVIVVPNYPAIDPRTYYDSEYIGTGILLVNKIDYNFDFDIPADPGYWPLIFFIADSVDRDEYGNIININVINIPDGRLQAMNQLILRYKPLHSWAVLVMTLTQYLSGININDGSDLYLDGSWWLNGFARPVV